MVQKQLPGKLAGSLFRQCLSRDTMTTLETRPLGHIEHCSLAYPDSKISVF